jgi:hypothetical protein
VSETDRCARCGGDCPVTRCPECGGCENTGPGTWRECPACAPCDGAELPPCEICVSGGDECGACGGTGEDDDGYHCCLWCGGTGWAVPGHCCLCGGSPYCTCCRTCGECVATCQCPVTVRLHGGGTRTLTASPREATSPSGARTPEGPRKKGSPT